MAVLTWRWTAVKVKGLSPLAIALVAVGVVALVLYLLRQK